MENTDPSATISWDDLPVVGQYATQGEAHDHALVILAMGEACWVAADLEGGDFKLHTEVGVAARALHELEIYAGEQDDQRRLRNAPEPVDPFHFSAGWEVFLVWTACLIAVFHFQGLDPRLTDRAASSSIGLISRHEWWRPFTALFLHADVPHLVGNLLSGAVFGTLVSRSLGPLRGWALILGCGTLGNILTSLANYPERFESIGASTAVFGALGILTGLGFSVSLRLRSSVSWAKAAAPVMAGLVLLGWLGAGSPGSNTDVLGHVLGFGSGLVGGVIVGEIRQKPSKAPLLSIV